VISYITCEEVHWFSKHLKAVLNYKKYIYFQGYLAEQNTFKGLADQKLENQES